MRLAVLLLAALLAGMSSACASHAARVRCDGHLVPINPSSLPQVRGEPQSDPVRQADPERQAGSESSPASHSQPQSRP